MEEKFVALMMEYEAMFEATFWEIANDSLAEQFEKMNPDDCTAQIHAQIEAWFATPNEISDGLTPVAFVAALNEPDTLAFIDLIYENSSEVIHYYAEAFRAKKDFLYGQLVAVFDRKTGALIQEEDDYCDGLFFELSTLFSIYQDPNALDLFLAFIMKAPEGQEDLVDFVQGLLGRFGASATQRFLDEVAQAQRFAGRIENIYSAISQSGSKNDASFEALKRLFENAHKKSFAAICFSVYGDPRAVPVLVEWVEHVPAEGYDKTEVGDVLAALKKLNQDGI